MSDLLNYFKAQAEKESASNLYNYAGTKLELLQIKERLAEIKSQGEPLNSMLGDKVHCIDDAQEQRKLLYAAAYYVVVGRKPDKEANE